MLYYKNKAGSYITACFIFLCLSGKKGDMCRRCARKRLVATASRCEDVYNRAGEPSVTFCGKEKHRHERAPTWRAERRTLLKTVR